ncbi:hypothetical protein AB4G91_08525 [Macrococcoides goetzii]|uniref:hypothetical protein n=1 Tax=Macrococcus sp. PK TaxID=2801919 RepID=UPI001F0CFAD8|nr:hypothetical protein [Macrococcus sp. PK]MCH4984330.1 hypothetical protein [Macrococcus sp. PK]MCH4985753.1 hypothetical protein [Macrococcus sp. PK]
MKKWISILLMSVVLCACGKAEDAPKKVDHKPDIEVKVKPPVDKKKTDDTKKTAKKEKNSTKEKKEKNSTATTTTTKTVQTSRGYDTERYNLARTCLVTPGKEKTADCQDISHTSEYSKAWNNLTSEGYICRSGQCNLAVQTETEEKTIEKQEKVTNEQKSTVPITTEVIPAKPDKTTEPKTTEPKTTEPPQTSESDEVRTTEPKTTEQKNTLTKEDTAQQSRSAVQDNSDDNNQ